MTSDLSKDLHNAIGFSHHIVDQKKIQEGVTLFIVDDKQKPPTHWWLSGSSSGYILLYSPNFCSTHNISSREGIRINKTSGIFQEGGFVSIILVGANTGMPIHSRFMKATTSARRMHIVEEYLDMLQCFRVQGS